MESAAVLAGDFLAGALFAAFWQEFHTVVLLGKCVTPRETESLGESVTWATLAYPEMCPDSLGPAVETSVFCGRLLPAKSAGFHQTPDA